MKNLDKPALFDLRWLVFFVDRLLYIFNLSITLFIVFLFLLCRIEIISSLRIQAIKKDIEKNREKKDVVILVLGNKKDKGATRQVDTTQV